VCHKFVSNRQPNGVVVGVAAVNFPHSALSFRLDVL
jgi:hypothetical protein